MLANPAAIMQQQACLLLPLLQQNVLQGRRVSLLVALEAALGALTVALFSTQLQLVSQWQVLVQDKLVDVALMKMKVLADTHLTSYFSQKRKIANLPLPTAIAM